MDLFLPQACKAATWIGDMNTTLQFLGMVLLASLSATEELNL
jgi:hypothetical protein